VIRSGDVSWSAAYVLLSPSLKRKKYILLLMLLLLLLLGWAGHVARMGGEGCIQHFGWEA
jgi:hypothetical protein